MRPNVWRWLAAIAWALFLVWLGSRPSDSLPAQDWWLARFDKLIHGTMYGVAGFLAAWAARWRSLGATLVFGALWGAVWGGVDELLQSQAPGRFSDAADWAADIAGATVGAWAARTLPQVRRFFGS